MTVEITIGNREYFPSVKQIKYEGLIQETRLHSAGTMKTGW